MLFTPCHFNASLISWHSRISSPTCFPSSAFPVYGIGVVSLSGGLRASLDEVSAVVMNACRNLVAGAHGALDEAGIG